MDPHRSPARSEGGVFKNLESTPRRFNDFLKWISTRNREWSQKNL